MLENDKEMAREIHTEEDKETSVAKANGGHKGGPKDVCRSCGCNQHAQQGPRAVENIANGMEAARAKVESTAWMNR